MEEEVDLKHLERLRILLDVLLNGMKGTLPMSTIVKRMHEALASLESFPVNYTPSAVSAGSALRGLGGRSLAALGGKSILRESAVLIFQMCCQQFWS